MSLRGVVAGVLLCGALLSLAARVEAQRLVGKGVKAGLAVSELGGGIGDVIAAERRIGLSGGAFVTIALGRIFQLQPELLFVSKGARGKSFLTNASGTTLGMLDETWALDYLEIPVLARIALGSGGSVRPSLLVGPALAIKLRSRFQLGAPSQPLSQDLDFVTGTDFGLVMGAGADLGRGPRGFLLDARYTLGLTNVWGSQSALDAHNRTLALMAGYRF